MCNLYTDFATNINVRYLLKVSLNHHICVCSKSNFSCVICSYANKILKCSSVHYLIANLNAKNNFCATIMLLIYSTVHTHHDSVSLWATWSVSCHVTQNTKTKLPAASQLDTNCKLHRIILYETEDPESTSHSPYLNSKQVSCKWFTSSKLTGTTCRRLLTEIQKCADEETDKQQSSRNVCEEGMINNKHAM